jgi:hypothetical protein
VIAVIVLARNNRPKGSGSGGYVGSYFIKEMVVAGTVSGLALLVNYWLLINYLARFSKTCCGAASSAPDILDPIQWRVYYGAMLGNAIFSFVAVFFLVRALMSHFWPLRNVTYVLTDAGSKQI